MVAQIKGNNSSVWLLRPGRLNLTSFHWITNCKSSSRVTRKKTGRTTWPREILEARRAPRSSDCKNELWALTMNFHCVLRSVFLYQWKIKVIKTQHRRLESYCLQRQHLQNNWIVPLCLLASIWYRGNLFKFPFPPLSYDVNSPFPTQHWRHTSPPVHTLVKFLGCTLRNVDVSIWSTFTHWYNDITPNSIVSLRKFKC